MKRTIIANIEQPVKIHFKSLTKKQIFLKDLITNEEVKLTMNLRSDAGIFIMSHTGICILNLSFNIHCTNVYKLLLFCL